MLLSADLGMYECFSRSIPTLGAISRLSLIGQRTESHDEELEL
jgi:hypothetical protein